jgi:hypothetical protein
MMQILPNWTVTYKQIDGGEEQLIVPNGDLEAIVRIFKYSGIKYFFVHEQELDNIRSIV